MIASVYIEPHERYEAIRTPRNTMKKTNYKTPPATIDTVELCKELVTHAAFAKPKLREKIYKAVRQLQLLDKLAADAGLLSSAGQAPPKHP